MKTFSTNEASEPKGISETSFSSPKASVPAPKASGNDIEMSNLAEAKNPHPAMNMPEEIQETSV